MSVFTILFVIIFARCVINLFVCGSKLISRTRNRRRQRLAMLLQAEHDSYTRELEESVETDEQRRQRMIKQVNK